MTHTKFQKISFLAAQVLICCAAVAQAQQISEKKPPIPFPVIPVVGEYEYEPHYFMQWIAGHAQYSMIEATVGDGRDAADAQVIMTEKSTGKRVFYCASEARIKSLRAAGKDAYLTKIDFKQTPGAAEQQQPVYGFGFQDKDGQPIVWRVTAASRPSGQGAGISTTPATVSGLHLAYRDLGTAVGEGTAIQISGKVVEAEPWTEISAPPYFVAYRGAVTDGHHVGTLLLKTEKWSVAARPGELKTGAEWILKDESGRERTLKIVSQNKDEFVIDEINQSESAPLRLIVRSTATGFAVRSVEWQSSNQKMRIAFAPELPPLGCSSASDEH